MSTNAGFRMSRATVPSSYSIKSSNQRPTRFTRYSRNLTHLVQQREGEYVVRRSLLESVSEELDNKKRQLFYQRVTIFAKNVSVLDLEAGKDEKDALKEVESEDEIKADFKSSFEERLGKILEYCERQTFVSDNLSGLYLYMGDYTLLVVESCEDMVGYFMSQLAKASATFWQANRVFLVEDKIEDTYFDAFVSRRSAAMNVNEKFATATPNDVELMGTQHWKIKEKVRILCSTLRELLLRERAEEEEEQEEEGEEEEEEQGRGRERQKGIRYA